MQNHEYIGIESAQANREKTIYDTIVIETLEFQTISIGVDTAEDVPMSVHEPKSVSLLHS